jgi:hypothetical protein
MLFTQAAAAASGVVYCFFVLSTKLPGAVAARLAADAAELEQQHVDRGKVPLHVCSL